MQGLYGAGAAATAPLGRNLPARREARSALQAGRVQAQRLQQVDAEVRAHEQAHIAAAGPYARSGPQYIYAVGPDGRLYAVGGSVAVDLKPVPGNPEATLRKARALLRAAFGPTQPSAADLRVAAAAYRLEMQARRELAREEAEAEGRRPQPGLQVNVLV